MLISQIYSMNALDQPFASSKQYSGQLLYQILQAVDRNDFTLFFTSEVVAFGRKRKRRCHSTESTSFSSQQKFAARRSQSTAFMLKARIKRDVYGSIFDIKISNIMSVNAYFGLSVYDQILLTTPPPRTNVVNVVTIISPNILDLFNKVTNHISKVFFYLKCKGLLNLIFMKMLHLDLSVCFMYVINPSNSM